MPIWAQTRCLAFYVLFIINVMFYYLSIFFLHVFNVYIHRFILFPFLCDNKCKIPKISFFFPFLFQNPNSLSVHSHLIFNSDLNPIRQLKVLEISKEIFQTLEDLITIKT